MPIISVLAGDPIASHVTLDFLSPSLSPLLSSAIFLPKDSEICPQFSRRPSPLTFSWAPVHTCSPKIHSLHKSHVIFVTA